MDRQGVRSLYELAEAMVTADDDERVRLLLEQYEAGDIDLGDLIAALQSLHRRMR